MSLRMVLEGELRKHLDPEELNILDDSIEAITRKQRRIDNRFECTGKPAPVTLCAWKT